MPWAQSTTRSTHMTWTGTSASARLRVNVQINAINDGRLDVYTANASIEAYISTLRGHHLGFG